MNPNQDLNPNSQSIGTPASSKQPVAQAAGVSDADADLEARLDALKRQ